MYALIIRTRLAALVLATAALAAVLAAVAFTSPASILDERPAHVVADGFVWPIAPELP